MERIITVFVILAVLCVVVWVARAVLDYLKAPHVAFVIVTAIACLVALLFALQALGVTVPGL